MKLCLFTLLFSALFSFSVLAAPATPSVASPSMADLGELDDEDLEALEVLTDRDFIDIFYDYMNSLTGGPQNAALESEEANLDEPADVIPYDGPMEMAFADTDDFVNTVRFDVTVSGTFYTLLFPSSDYGAFFVDETGNLWNVSDSVVTGLVVDGDFNPYSDEGTLVYLQPCLGNNFSDNHEGGSPNTFRRYYWTGGSYDRLTYTEEFVHILVTDTYYPARTEDILDYALLFLVGGGVLICWSNRFKRY